MSVIAFPVRSTAATQQVVDWPTAQEIGRRFYDESDAAPTIAAALGLTYETVCAVLDGRIWPASRRFWMDRVLP